LAYILQFGNLYFLKTTNKRPNSTAAIAFGHKGHSSRAFKSIKSIEKLRKLISYFGGPIFQLKLQEKFQLNYEALKLNKI
jgi:hypothetical protein